MSARTVFISHEKIALGLCTQLVEQGKEFRCETRPGGWEFEVSSSEATTEGTHAQTVEAQQAAARALASEADLAHLRSGKGGSTRAMSDGRTPEPLEFTAQPSDLGAPERLVDGMRKTDIQRLAGAIAGQVAKFSDQRLNDGDDVWRERELEYRCTVAQTANAICLALGLDAQAFASACGLYVSDGRDSYSDCYPGELTWEKPRTEAAS